MYDNTPYESLNCVSFGSPATAKKVIILLHGYGSDANDLIAVAPMFKDIKDTLFIAVNAPYNCDNGFGRQWFPLIVKDNGKGGVDIGISSVLEVKIASSMVMQLIEEIQDHHNIDTKDISLFGFSQGGVLALYTALHSQIQFDSVISHSGVYYGDENEEFNYNQNILMIHGDSDDVLPLSKFYNSIEYLNKNNISFESHIEANLPHSINQNTINICEKFLIKNS